MANKFGNKMAPNDPDLPAMLRPVGSDRLAGSPKGGRTGPLGSANPTPPVARRGSKTQKAVRIS